MHVTSAVPEKKIIFIFHIIKNVRPVKSPALSENILYRHTFIQTSENLFVNE